MSAGLHDVLATDLALDLIGRRDVDGSGDDVLDSLAALATAVDELPLPGVALPDDDQSAPLARPTISRTHRGGLAVGATVALLLSSSGVAAAMSGDAWAPLHYVAKQVLRLGPHDAGRSPGWQGSGPIGSVRSPGIGHAAPSHLTVPHRVLPATVPSRGRPPVYDVHLTGHTKPPSSPTSGRHQPPGQGPGGRDHGGSTTGSGSPGGSGGTTGPVVPSRPSNPRHGHGSGTGLAGLVGQTSGTARHLLAQQPVSTARGAVDVASALPAASSSSPSAPPTVSLTSSPASRPHSHGDRAGSTR